MENSNENKSIHDDTLNNNIRQLVTSGTIPIHVIYDDTDHFRKTPRLSYLHNLATTILMNNACDFEFRYGTFILNPLFPIGVLYDLVDCKTLPWEIHLRKLDTSRVNLADVHMNMIKHAEYLEKGTTSRISNFSKEQHKDIETCLIRDDFQSNLLFPYENINGLKSIATRFHFKDGTSIVSLLDLDSTVFGICQGIILKNEQVKDILYLKSTDYWLHICFPNAYSTIIEEFNEINKKLTVTFRPVGNIAIIKDNLVVIPITTKITTCENYVRRKLNLAKHLRIFLYLDGLFQIFTNEYLFNITPNKDKITLFYSVGEAWK